MEQRCIDREGCEREGRESYRQSWSTIFETGIVTNARGWYDVRGTILSTGPPDYYVRTGKLNDEGTLNWRIKNRRCLLFIQHL